MQIRVEPADYLNVLFEHFAVNVTALPKAGSHQYSDALSLKQCSNGCKQRFSDCFPQGIMVRSPFGQKCGHWIDEQVIVDKPGLSWWQQLCYSLQDCVFAATREAVEDDESAH